METLPTIKNEEESEVLVLIEKLSILYSSITKVTQQKKKKKNPLNTTNQRENHGNHVLILSF